MAGGPVWDATCLCFGDRRVPSWVAAMRAVQQYSSVGGMPHCAGHGRGDDGPRGTPDAGAIVCEGRPVARNELCIGPGTGGADAGPRGWRIDRELRALAGDLFPEYSCRFIGLDHGVPTSAGLQGRACAPAGFCGAGAVRVRDCASVVCSGGIWRARAERP